MSIRKGLPICGRQGIRRLLYHFRPTRVSLDWYSHVYWRTVLTKTGSERYDCYNHIPSLGCGVNLSSKKNIWTCNYNGFVVTDPIPGPERSSSIGSSVLPIPFHLDFFFFFLLFFLSFFFPPFFLFFPSWGPFQMKTSPIFFGG